MDLRTLGVETIVSREHPVGDPGGRLSIEEVARFATAGRGHPVVIAWVGHCLKAAGGPQGDVEKARAILDAVRKDTVYMLDPVWIEHMRGAHLTLSGLFPGVDCDDATIAFLAACLACGIRCAAVGHGFDKSGTIGHVLGAIESGGKWYYGDASVKDVPLGSWARKPTWEYAISLPDQSVICDAKLCLTGPKPPRPGAITMPGEFLGVSGVPALGVAHAVPDEDAWEAWGTYVDTFGLGDFLRGTTVERDSGGLPYVRVRVAMRADLARVPASVSGIPFVVEALEQGYGVVTEGANEWRGGAVPCGSVFDRLGTGAILGVTTTSDVVAAITATDSEVDSLDTNIAAKQASLPAGFVDSWTHWKATWKTWRDENLPVLGQYWWTGPSAVMDERNGWQAQLYAWSQQYQNATGQKPGGLPVEKPPEPGPDLTKTVANAADTFATAAKWIGISLLAAGAVAVGIVLFRETERASPPVRRVANPDDAEKLYLQRVRLNAGGYDPRGRYFGIGAPLWEYWTDRGEIHSRVRARDREEAKREIRKQHRSATFFRNPEGGG
jgi:hypothetical protein